MKILYVAMTGLCLLALGANSVMADKLVGSATSTAFSGKSGADFTLRKNTSDNDAVFAVDIAERSDDPCFMRVRYRDVSSGKEASSLRFAKCNDNNNNEGKQSSRKSVVLPDNLVTTGVRICLNGSGTKMKAIALRARMRDCVLGEDSVTLSVDGCSQVFKQGGMEYRLCSTGDPKYQVVSCKSNSAIVTRHFERTNCVGSKRGPDGDWEKQVDCPDGKVATGIKLSTRKGGGKREMIDGVALECTSLSSAG